jgi:hypothetical protein
MPAFPAHGGARSGSTAGDVFSAGGTQKACVVDMVGGSELGVARRARWGELGAGMVSKP